MLLSQAENYVSDYAASEHFLFLNPEAKENAESMLLAFFRAAQGLGVEAWESFQAKDVEAALSGMARLDLPVAARRAIPDLLEGFFGFLKDSGRYPPAAAWQMCVESVRSKYLDSLRADGSVRGETFKKRYTDVGRNDACPCGSGKKFKKCCMLLIQ